VTKIKSKYHFILNPVAGRGKSYRAIKKIRSMLREFIIDHKISITDAPCHATELAKESLMSEDVVVAVGGDGTINEVMNGLVNSKKAFGILPLGSGNDFAKATNIPCNMHEAIKVILNNKRKLIDIGKVSTSNDFKNNLKQTTQRYFINGIGIGFDASVAYQSSKIKMLRGLPLYIASIVKALLTYRISNYLLKLDDREFNNRFFLISVGNGQYAGGGFYLTPDAKLDDSKFDVCYVDKVNLLEIIKIFPSVLKGLHGKYKKVHFTQAKRISVNSLDRFFVHADGEIVGKDINNVDIAIIPKAIEVIVG
jgi:diacylglycerol kinase (ATP)